MSSPILHRHPLSGMALLLALAAACNDRGQRGPIGRVMQMITDGEIVSKDEEPTVAAVLIGEGDSLKLCTGTLVGSQTVLTAAHCILEGQPYQIFISGVPYGAQSAKRHPQYDSANLLHDHDLGLIFLDAAPPVTPAVAALSVAPTKAMALTLVGFGAASSSTMPTGDLRRANNLVDAVSPLGFTVVGTGDGEGNVCSSDSGGPAFFGHSPPTGDHRIQIGVASTGSTPCGWLSRYIRLDAYADWLVQEAGDDLHQPDTEPPQVNILAPKEGDSLISPFNLVVTASDNTEVVSLSVTVDLEPAATVAVEGVEPPYEVELALDPGQHGIEATVTDAAGNQTSQRLRVRVVKAEPDAAPSEPAPVTDGADAGSSDAGPAGGSDNSGGCRLGRGHRVGWLLYLLGLALLGRARRRRRGVR